MWRSYVHRVDPCLDCATMQVITSCYEYDDLKYTNPLYRAYWTLKACTETLKMKLGYQSVARRSLILQAGCNSCALISGNMKSTTKLQRETMIDPSRLCEGTPIAACLENVATVAQSTVR